MKLFELNPVPNAKDGKMIRRFTNITPERNRKRFAQFVINENGKMERISNRVEISKYEIVGKY